MEDWVRTAMGGTRKDGRVLLVRFSYFCEKTL